MMNKIKNGIKRALYAMPFGIKAADDEIIGSNSEYNGIGTNINQEVSDERVAKHLLKGEVTQEVEELRYRTYKVADESKNYEYIGNGTAMRKENTPIEGRTKWKFSQENKTIVSSVLESLENMEEYKPNAHTAIIEYDNPLVKFKMEQFCTTIDVQIENERSLTKLHFSSIPDGYEKKSAPFINELKKMKDAYDSSLENDNWDNVKNHFEIANSMLSLSFVTYKATNNEPDMINYAFLNPNLIKISEENNEIILYFTWELFVCNDLRDKFYSLTMDEKYKNKAKKNVSIDIVGSTERKRYCSECGKEISVYDGDIMDYNTDKPMCLNCYIKSLNIEEK